jgi:hypothetical protein
MHLLVVFVELLALSFISTYVAIAIDDPNCIIKVGALLNQSSNPDFVPNLLRVDVSTCIQACRASWNWYDAGDIYKHIAL